MMVSLLLKAPLLSAVIQLWKCKCSRLGYKKLCRPGEQAQKCLLISLMLKCLSVRLQDCFQMLEWVLSLLVVPQSISHCTKTTKKHDQTLFPHQKMCATHDFWLGELVYNREKESVVRSRPWKRNWDAKRTWVYFQNFFPMVANCRELLGGIE